MKVLGKFEGQSRVDWSIFREGKHIARWLFETGSRLYLYWYEVTEHGPEELSKLSPGSVAIMFISKLCLTMNQYLADMCLQGELLRDVWMRSRATWLPFGLVWVGLKCWPCYHRVPQTMNIRDECALTECPHHIHRNVCVCPYGGKWANKDFFYKIGKFLALVFLAGYDGYIHRDNREI